MFINLKVYRQFILVFIVNLAALNAGWILAWTSPVGAILTDEELSPVGAVTIRQLSWIVSLLSLASVPAALLAGLLANKLGRKWTSLFVVLPQLTSWLLAYFATNVSMLYATRLLSGMANGIFFTTAPMYACELASKEIRGSLGAVTNIFVTLGQVAMLTLGPFLTYGVIQLIGIITSLFTLLVVFVPESPYFNFVKGNHDVALKTLLSLRSDVKEAEEELKFMELQQTNHAHTKLSKLLQTKSAKRGMLLALFVCSSQHFTGWIILMMYLQSIIESTGTGLSTQLSSVVVGLIQIVGCLTSILSTDRLGRKPLICGTSLVTAVAMTMLGVHYHLLASNVPIEGILMYLPIISICLIAFSFNCGIGALAFPLIAELFNDDLRSFGMSLVQSISLLLSFGITNLFPTILERLGGAYTYWIFAFLNAFIFGFVFVLVPETKGKSIQEIQSIITSKIMHVKRKV